VFLNSGSKFRYPNQFNQSERNVFLEGEAYFKVKSNKKLPFKVNTQSLQVEVLGTSFNVSAYPGDGYQAVVLEEGKVQINELSGEKIDEIHPGQIALKRDGVEGVKIEGIEPYQYTSWKDGKVVFEGERLSDIAKKLERWYNVEIRFEKEKLKDYKFTGTILRNKPIDQSILALELLAPIRFRYEVKTEEKNVIVIVGR
jgi:ferric-dicitrate binding protein FerR (iron transport regulator)